jgi:hypothetical protein
MLSKKAVCFMVLSLALATLTVGHKVSGMYSAPAVRADGGMPPPPPVPIPWAYVA